MLVALALVPSPAGANPLEIEDVRETPIQPGGLFHVGETWCTFNFVWRDAVGGLYIGTAAHCTDGVGSRVRVSALGEIGTVVFEDAYFDGAAGIDGTPTPTQPWRDFSLILIDEDKASIVEPSVRFWGGPTGIQDAFLPGAPTLHTGNGLGAAAALPTRARAGSLEIVYGPEGGPRNGIGVAHWYMANHPISGGDSGSGLMTFDGKALGVASIVAPTWGEAAIVGGPTFLTIQRDLVAAGFDVELVTAPLHDAATLARVGAMYAQRCVAEPYGDARSDACIRDPKSFPAPFVDAPIFAPASGTPTGSGTWDDTESQAYWPTKGAAVETSSGIVGVAAAGVGTTPPFRAPHDLRMLDAIIDDETFDHAYFAICIHVGTNPEVCSDQTDTDIIVRGLDRAAIEMHVPAGTWIEPMVYTLYVAPDGAAYPSDWGTVTTRMAFGCVTISTCPRSGSG